MRTKDPKKRKGPYGPVGYYSITQLAEYIGGKWNYLDMWHLIRLDLIPAPNRYVDRHTNGDGRKYAKPYYSQQDADRIKSVFEAFTKSQKEIK